jgi:hypothetical protein
MRTILIAASAALFVVCSVVACSSDPESAPSPAASATDPSTPPDSTSDDATAPLDGSTSKDASPSKDGSTSPPADAGPKDAGPVVCTAPALTATKTLGALSSAERGQLCDYSACPFGGYGKSKSCGASTFSAKQSQAACLADPTWTKCASVTAGDYLACTTAMNVDPCKSLQVLTTDPACASVKACAF